jgi:hypothetical protein
MPTPSPVPTIVGWAQSPVPNEWQWLGLIIGIVGFILALLATPSALQMFFGRPHIQIEFGTRTRQGLVGSYEQVMECQLYNRPIKRAWVRALGIRRTPAEDLCAFYTIQEVGSNRMLRDGRLAHITGPAEPEARTHVILPASIRPSTFPISSTTMVEGGSTTLLDPEHPEPLAPSTYVVSVVVTSGEDEFRGASQLVIGWKAEDVVWRPLDAESMVQVAYRR